MRVWLVGVSVGPDEDKFAIGAAFDPPSCIMDQAVVVSTQGGEVVEVRGSAVDPMDQVMGVDPQRPFAAREATASVTSSDLAIQLGGNGAAGTTDPDWQAVGSTKHSLKTRITGEPAGRVGVDGGTSLDLADAMAGGEGLQVDVNHHTGPVRVGIVGKAG